MGGKPEGVKDAGAGDAGPDDRNLIRQESLDARPGPHDLHVAQVRKEVGDRDGTGTHGRHVDHGMTTYGVSITAQTASDDHGAIGVLLERKGPAHGAQNGLDEWGHALD